MALLHNDATLTPSKLELLRGWVPGQPWAAGVQGSALETVGAYRFDDPAGEVGIETFLLAAGDGTVLQVPLTYRAAPLAGAESSLIGTTEHTVLGTRYVYDGCADPVYAAELTATIVTGGTQADLEYASGEHRTSPTQVRGSATDPLDDARLCGFESDRALTRLDVGAATVTLLRRPDGASADGSAEATLTGSWPGSEASTVLAVLHRA